MKMKIARAEPTSVFVMSCVSPDWLGLGLRGIGVLDRVVRRDEEPRLLRRIEPGRARRS